MASHGKQSVPGSHYAGHGHPHQPAKITRRTTGRCVRLVVEGELDSFSAHILESAIRQEDKTLGVEEVCVDLEAASFIDAGCVGVLVAAARRANRAHWRLKVENGQGIVRRVLEITQLEAMISHWQSTDLPEAAAAGGMQGSLTVRA
ncbi:MAG TPA: STAS domain-containing protein [Actinomycetota bacterium]|nr:STAS domain-containing protein [Actinomycetota bacterium]